MTGGETTAVVAMTGESEGTMTATTDDEMTGSQIGGEATIGEEATIGDAMIVETTEGATIAGTTDTPTVAMTDV